MLYDMHGYLSELGFTAILLPFPASQVVRASKTPAPYPANLLRGRLTRLLFHVLREILYLLVVQQLNIQGLSQLSRLLRETRICNYGRKISL